MKHVVRTLAAYARPCSHTPDHLVSCHVPSLSHSHVSTPATSSHSHKGTLENQSAALARTPHLTHHCLYVNGVLLRAPLWRSQQLADLRTVIRSPLSAL